MLSYNHKGGVIMADLLSVVFAVVAFMSIYLGIVKQSKENNKDEKESDK